MIALLKQSCCGCSLSTGTKIIAFLSLLGCLVNILFDSYALNHSIYSYNHMGHLKPVNEDEKLSVMLNMSLLIGSLTISSIDIIISSLLILAVYQHRPKLVIPWLVASILSLVLFGVGVVILLITGTFLHAFILLVAMGISLYCWWVVYSYYHELREKGVNVAPRTTSI